MPKSKMKPTSSPVHYQFLWALTAGALAPLALSPINFWPLGILSVALLYQLVKLSSPRQAALLGWWYGLGFFGVGTSWVYVSIYVYGNTPAFLAAGLTLLFVAALACFFVLQCWLFSKFTRRVLPILGFSACWVLVEWFRAWFLTGFPWLYLGYAHVTTLVSGIAPMFGVLGLSFLVVCSGAILAELFSLCSTARSLLPLVQRKLGIVLLLIWIFAICSTQVSWVTLVPEKNFSVGLVQANIDQNEKFDSANIQRNLDRYEELSSSLWKNDMVLWSETAIPLLYQNANDVLDYFSALALRNDSALVSGIFYEESDKIYNSITVLGNGSGSWHKLKLVPFGEYVPLRSTLASVLEIFSLPMSSLAPGPAGQNHLSIKNLQVAPFICYEVAYQELVREQAINADFLLTISNDSWFGASWGPPQHLQMAAMRARENARFMVRATNNGISAIINEKGSIVARTKQFRAETLSGNVSFFTGRTPYSYWGSWPVLGLCFCIFIINFLPIISRQKK